MTLAQFKTVLDKNFGPPYLPKGEVRTRWVKTKKGRVLEVVIGRRDVWIDEGGKVVGAGTCLTA